MADFVSVLRRAVGNLENNTEASRQAIYGKARAALRAQLEAIDPPLGPEDIARQIEGLDKAVADLETEFAAESGSAEAAETPPSPTVAESTAESADPADAPPPQAATPPPPSAPASAAAPEPAAEPAAAPKPHQTFQAAVSESGALGGAASTAARQARETLDRLGPDDDNAAGDGATVEDLADPYSAPHHGGPGDPGMPPSAGLAGSDDLAEQEAAIYAGDEADERGGSGRFVAWIILFLVLAGIAGVGYWQRETVSEIVASMTAEQEAVDGADGGKIADRLPAPESEQPPAAQPETPPAETPAPAPLPSEQATETPAPDTVAPAPSEPPSAADAEGERIAQALLIEESAGGGVTPANTLGGSVDWALVDDTEAVGGTEKVIRGRVNVPEKGLGVVVSIRRNQDQALPASHLIELVFDTGADFEHGGIASIPGIIMKATPRSTGQPLVGAVVPVMDGYFLVGLSESDIDRTRNEGELKSRDFIDIPIAYKDGGRAVLSLAKGETGTRVFNEAFAAWEQ